MIQMASNFLLMENKVSGSKSMTLSLWQLIETHKWLSGLSMGNFKQNNKNNFWGTNTDSCFLLLILFMKVMKFNSLFES